MRICLDVRNIKTTMTGVGRYARDLARGVARLDHDNEYVLLTNPDFPHPIVDQANFRQIPVPGDISSVRSALTCGRIINRLKPDVYHALAHFLPFGVAAPRLLITLHDLMWIETPRLCHPNALKAAYNQVIKGWFQKSAIRRAHAVVAISEATRQRAIEVLNMPPHKCEVVHHGVSGHFKDHAGAPPSPGVRDLIQGRIPYIFSLGHTKPYKNADGTLRAFARVARTHADLKLVVAGRGEGYPALKRLARGLGVIDRVVFLTSLPDTDVVYLYQNAVCFSFPSFVEGFGLPILEAMMAGCPVVTSNVSAPREVAGDAGLLVDPFDVDAIAAGFTGLLNDASLRDDLIRRGRERAAGFSIEQCARRTHAMYTAPPAAGINRPDEPGY